VHTEAESHRPAVASATRDRWPLIVLAGALAAIALNTISQPTDIDSWWHLRSGDLILDRGHIPGDDPFAWTAAGHPWRLNSWLFDVLAAGGRRLLGAGPFTALILLGVIGFGCACYLLARRAGARPWPSVAVAAVLTVLLTPIVAERPHMLTYLLFAATLVVAPAALHGSRHALVGLAAMFVFWVNLHFAFTVGVMLVALLAIATAHETRQLRRPALVTGTVLAAGLLNPFGWRAYGAALETRGTSRVIEEWQRLDPMSLRDFLYLLVIALALVSLWRTGRWRRLNSLLPVGAFSLLAFDAVRNVPFLMLVAAGEFGLSCSALRLPRARALLRERGPIATHGLALGLTVAALLALPALADARPASEDVYPVRTTAAIPRGCRLLNEDTFGGYITDKRWPDVLVSLDSRNGSEQDIERQLAVLEGRAGAMAWVDGHGVDCALVRPDRPIVSLLRDEGWQAVASDPNAILLVRP
jgi:hypothetical protein